MINLILCGGSGTRLWPLSRKYLPKQFVKIFDGESLFQKTVKRNMHLCDELFIISGENQYFLAVDQLEELDILKNKKVRFFLESEGRNTAPAIALSCFDMDPQETVLVCPSDHIVSGQDIYEQAVARAAELAEEENLVTFGISPSYPETGYGYIQAKGEDVIAFKEKPDAATAQKYLKSGDYLWNSGMFCFKSSTILKAMAKHSKDIFEASENAYNNRSIIGENQFKIKKKDMQSIPAESIDYAVMERTDNVKVVYGEFGWNDVGSFKSLFDLSEKDIVNNAVLNLQTEKVLKPVVINARDNLIINNKRQIAVIGEDNLVVVDTDDALLIANKSESQKVKEIVNQLKERGSELAEIHKTVIRPWGSYAILEEGPLYKIKKITVKAGKRLSLQKHFHRNEHWVVVSGTAKVTLDDEVFLLRQNESTFIKMGAEHRLENPGNIELVIIESQVGEYTGEDDIVRIEDDFKRNE
ncbi:MAG TPA: mannose-1-phosphate guanylyltransferase/mannose-6-phosphate isomerase [Flexistipes sinusarabici]|uniref:mannose-1-phosphate guanylyltransferase n=1 Tax=Flexistipes sinusarabici TaxID=2352 RepID=A0A3D5QBF2_FLESI|nr:mannose-1-phosphate guanylyltransferase/mannose-6-phosphate isomerase [Flexistipes sinusarabici]